MTLSVLGILCGGLLFIILVILIYSLGKSASDADDYNEKLYLQYLEDTTTSGSPVIKDI